MTQNAADIDIINQTKDLASKPKAKPVQPKSLSEIVRAALKKNLDNKQVAKANDKLPGLGNDSVQLSASKIASVVPQQSISKTQIKKMIMPKAKQRMAREKVLKLSTELYFNVENRLTYFNLAGQLEGLIEKLSEEHGVPVADLMDAKLEGKRLATSRIFETLAIMLALESVLAGGKRNKKARNSFLAKTGQFRTKLNLLGYDLDNSRLNADILEKGTDFLNLLKDNERDINNRLKVLDQFQKVEQALV